MVFINSLKSEHFDVDSSAEIDQPINRGCSGKSNWPLTTYSHKKKPSNYTQEQSEF